MVEGLKGLKI